MLNCVNEKRVLFRHLRFEYGHVPVMAGDTIRTTYTIDHFGVIRFSMAITYTCVITGMVFLVTEEGLAHVGLVQLHDTEQRYYQLPSVWQYNDHQDDDTLSLSERREQEISFMFSLADL